MFSPFGKITRLIYLQWKRSSVPAGGHPDEEALVCFAEGKLSGAEADMIQEHVTKCDVCAEYLSTQFKIEPHLSKDVPVALMDKAREIISLEDAKKSVFEIFLKLKEKALEIIHTSGDVLVGQELVPAPVLRSRQINEFKEEISVIKDLKELRVLVKVESKSAKAFNISVTILNKHGKKAEKSMRIALMKDGREMESYVSDTGGTIFENILPGDYRIEIMRGTDLTAVLDIRVQV